MIEHEQLYKDAIELWGADIQLFMFFEEVGELMQAISKLKRRALYEDDVSVYNYTVIEEIANVQIMLNQLKIIYGYNKEIEDKMIEFLAQLIEDGQKWKNIDLGVKYSDIYENSLRMIDGMLFFSLDDISQILNGFEYLYIRKLCNREMELSNSVRWKWSQNPLHPNQIDAVFSLDFVKEIYELISKGSLMNVYLASDLGKVIKMVDKEDEWTLD
jgi:NTP pyrophosphatase (non-canonical NTP hydrolase)